jgi:hypothetical protein
MTGNNAGYVQVASADTASLSQVLTTSLMNNTAYTLSAKLGDPGITSLNGIPVRFNYPIQLGAGSTMLASASNSALTPNSFGGDTLTYFSGGNDDISLTAALESGNVVLPQLAFGGGWYTALYFSNTNNSGPLAFLLNFFGDDGNPLNVPNIGTSIRVNLAGRGSSLIEIPNIGSLQQGYVTATLPNGVFGYGVFRLSVAGRNDQEAVVPLSGVTATVSTLLYDDTKYVTGVAVVNLSSSNTSITATARDAQANMIGTGSLSLPPNGKTAVTLRSIPGLASVAGTVGSVDFTSSGGDLAVLGLRFNEAAFTSIPTSDR